MDGRERSGERSPQEANIFLGNKHPFIAKWKPAQYKQCYEQEVLLIEIFSSLKNNVNIKYKYALHYACCVMHYTFAIH